jgi:hypothetical protein
LIVAALIATKTPGEKIGNSAKACGENDPPQPPNRTFGS